MIMNQSARDSAAEGRQHEADELARIDRYLATCPEPPAPCTDAEQAEIDAQIDAYFDATREHWARRGVRV